MSADGSVAQEATSDDSSGPFSRRRNVARRCGPVTATQARIASLLHRVRNNRDVAGASIFYVLERVLASAISFVVFTVLARFYAPAEFGIWSYTIAIVQFAAPFLAAGAEPIVVRELVRHADRRSEVLSSAAVVIALTTVVANAIPLLFLFITHPGDEQILTIAILASCSTIPNFMLVLEHYFRAELRPVPIVSARVVAALTGGTARVVLAVCGYPIVALAAVLSLEVLVQSGCLVFALLRGRREPSIRWSASALMTRQLARACLPAMVSGLIVTLFFRVNYLLVQNLAGFEEVGFYALAFNLVNIVTMVPSLALSGIYPKLVALSNRDRRQFVNAIRWLFFWGSLFGYFAIALVAVLGHIAVPMVFGSKYLPATNVLVVMIFALIVMISGAVRAAIINIAVDPIYHLWSTIIGLAVLLPISWVLIPGFGAVGAAFGIIVSSVASAVATTWAFPRLRPYAMDQLAGLLLLTPFRRAR